VLVGLSCWEWAPLTGLRVTTLRILFVIVFNSIWISAVLYLTPKPAEFTYLLWGLTAWWAVRLINIYRYKGSEKSQEYFHFGRALNVLVVIAAPFYFIHLLRNDFNEPGLLLYVLMTIWAADTFAYFAGRQWGKTKLAPIVSPGKSWQGVYGAILSAVLMSIIGAIIYEFNFISFIELLLLTVLVVVFSIIGDLSESLYKRQLKIKDSGQILPGHGGILDRVDSLTAAMPVYMLGINYMGLLK